MVGLLAVVYGIVHLGWPDQAQPSAATIAALAAAPLALALLWDRLTGFKAFGFEVALAPASTRIETEVVGAITEAQHFSGNEAIVEKVTEAIVRPEQELLELNLRDGNYWWSTRLFLLAALVEDYSRIQQLVFLERGGDQIFVGWLPLATFGTLWPRSGLSWSGPIKRSGKRLGRSRRSSRASLNSQG
ncbi:MAG TPA: hypothetical protein VGJ36_02940 [Gemmatimonadales bacterium]